MSLARSSLAALALLALACAPGRMADLRDSGRLSVAFNHPLSLGVEGRIGELTHPSLGIFAEGNRYGWEDRETGGTWHEMSAFWPVTTMGCDRLLEWSWWCLNLSRASARYDGYGYALSPFELLDRIRESESSRDVGYWTPLPAPGHLDPRWTWHSVTDLQVGANLSMIGVRVGANPLEFIDLLLGFAGFDIANDDPDPSPAGD